MIELFPFHGIGKKGSSTLPYSRFIAGIRKYLPLDFEMVIRPIDYSGLLDEREDKVYSWVKDMSPMWDLLAKKERSFISYYICDILAYAYTKRPPHNGDFMYDLQEMLAKRMALSHPKAKKVIIGHSLGAIAGYGATWDAHTDCLITMGNPFSWFSVRYAEGGEMNPDLREYHNFWTGRDRVSTIVSKNPKFSAVHDYEVPNWLPIHWTRLGAHSLYWTSDFVHKKIAKILIKLEESK